jgi:Do/DeqQ family serine protease
MKQLGRKKKVARLTLTLAAVCLLGPYLLCKLDFYGTSHAATASASQGSNPVAAISSTSPANFSSSAPVNNSNGAVSNNTSFAGPYSYADAVELAAPSVVSINTTTEVPIEMNPMMQDPFFRYFFGEQFGMDNVPPGMETTPGTKGDIPKAVRKGLGSGVIVSDKGYVLTNNHVVRDSTTVEVKLADGRTAKAKVIGSDSDSDLAVLKIELDKLPVISIGSSQKLRVGDVVLAIGNAFGFDNTVTQGIVSATERSAKELGNLESLIQTDAAINFGNSGGALIDARGRLIGINTAMYSRTGGYQGIGFAIPIDPAIEIMKKLIEGGHITRGYIGISMQGLNQELRETANYKEGDGIFVRAIVRGGPAQKAGLLPGDVITKINNTSIKDERQAFKLVASLTPGKSYPVEVFRKGEFVTFAIVLEERKQPQEQTQEAVGKKSIPEKNK